MANVPDLLQGCLTEFNSLVTSDSLARYIPEVPLQAWKDELGRLRVWAANIAQIGQSSLDYRLRDASHIKDQILSLLERVKELLLDLAEVLEEDADTENQYPLEGVEGLGDYPEDDDSITEVQQIHQGLLEAITHLYQMSMMIPQPAHHDRLIGTRKVDAEPFVFWAKQHASNKYPHADKVVIDRLSSTMARQRAILKYRERHHAKLSHGIYPEDEKSTMPPEPPVNNAFKERNQPDDLASEDGVSETSYNDYQSDGIYGGTDIPPIPQKGHQQNPFKCPYCFYTITVRDEQAWARHILRDLMPYVCVFPECSTPNRLYGSCRQWYAHVQQAHPITDTFYQCAICNQKHLPSVGFQQHVAGHLQKLALFYLPPVRPDEDEAPETRQEEESQSANAEQRLGLNSFDLTEKKDIEKKMPKGKLKKAESKVQRETEDDEREKFILEMTEKDSQKPYRVSEKSEKHIAHKETAIERWKLEQERTKQKEKQFRENLRSIGYTEEEIEQIKDKKNKRNKEGKDETEKEEKEETKTTWIKVGYLYPSSYSPGDTNADAVL